MHKRIRKILSGDGRIIIIETYGTNVIKPEFQIPVLEDYYRVLTEEYNFRKIIILGTHLANPLSSGLNLKDIRKQNNHPAFTTAVIYTILKIIIINGAAC